MDEASIRVRRTAAVDVVVVVGLLDYAASLRLRLVLYQSLDRGCRDIIVDLSAIPAIDECAIEVVMRVQLHVTERAGRLRALGAGAGVLLALDRCNASDALCARDSLAEALPARADADVESRPSPSHVRNTWSLEVTELLHRMALLALDDPRRRGLRQKAIEMSLPYVKRLAYRFQGMGEPLADLDQIAALGLVRAVDGYDPRIGSDFAAYALPTILGELKRHFRDYGWGVRVPRRLQELVLEMNRVRDLLTQRLGRAPSNADLAEHLDIDRKLVWQAIAAANAYRVSSLFAPVGPGDEHRTIDRLGAPDGALDIVDLRDWIRCMFRTLNNREKKILTMKFYGNMTQSQIAAELGISQMHVAVAQPDRAPVP